MGTTRLISEIFKSDPLLISTHASEFFLSCLLQLFAHPWKPDNLRIVFGSSLLTTTTMLDTEWNGWPLRSNGNTASNHLPVLAQCSIVIEERRTNLKLGRDHQMLSKGLSSSVRFKYKMTHWTFCISQIFDALR